MPTSCWFCLPKSHRTHCNTGRTNTSQSNVFLKQNWLPSVWFCQLESKIPLTARCCTVWPHDLVEWKNSTYNCIPIKSVSQTELITSRLTLLLCRLFFNRNCLSNRNDWFLLDGVQDTTTVTNENSSTKPTEHGTYTSLVENLCRKRSKKDPKIFSSSLEPSHSAHKFHSVKLKTVQCHLFRPEAKNFNRKLLLKIIR